MKEQLLKWNVNLKSAIRNSLLDEVMTTPKPGLVDQDDTGAHRDMDIQTFITSIDAIDGYLIQIANTGLGSSTISSLTLRN